MLFTPVSLLEPDIVLTWFDVCCEGLRRQEDEASRCLSARLEFPQPLLTVFPVGASQDAVADYFQSSKEELALAAIFTLIAAAEARIRDDAALRKGGTDVLAQRLKFLLTSVSTEWKVPLYEGGIIGAWKAYIQTLTDLGPERARILSAIGRFKNLLNIRHWVAHGRNWNPVWDIEQYSPARTAEIIADFFNMLRQVASHRGLMEFE